MACSVLTTFHFGLPQFQKLLRMLSTSHDCYCHEDIPEFDLRKTYTPETMLARIRDLKSKKTALLKRSFFQIDSKSKRVESENTVKVMQFNILAQALAQGADNFVLCPTEALMWNTRKYSLLEEVLIVDPDVLCLQEVDHFFFFKVMLEKIGYVGSFFPKPSSPCLDSPGNNGPDGCAMFYKTDKFEEIEHKHLILEAVGQKSNQVSIMLKLKHKRSGKVFCVATTHLKAKSGYDKLRFSQGSFLLEQVKAFSKDLPLVVCGDFNADPKEAVIGAFRDESSTLTSAYTALSQDGCQEPAYTTWKVRGGRKPGDPNSDVCRTIDYIWYRRSGMKIEAFLSIPSGEEIGPCRLPSWKYPSDHFSLAAVFSLV